MDVDPDAWLHSMGNLSIGEARSSSRPLTFTGGSARVRPRSCGEVETTSRSLLAESPRDTLGICPTPLRTMRSMPQQYPQQVVLQYHEPEDHSRRIDAMNGYIQFIFNLAMVVAVLYLLWMFYWTISNDIETKILIQSEKMRDAISHCAKKYSENRCEPHVRVPEMEQKCRAWEQCMNRDPYTVARRSKFSGETLGEAMNAFFEALAWKTIICICSLFFGVVLCYNATFNWMRHQKYPVYGHSHDPSMHPGPGHSHRGNRGHPSEAFRSKFSSAPMPIGDHPGYYHQNGHHPLGQPSSSPRRRHFY